MAHRVISENVVEEEKEVTGTKKTVVLDAGASDSSKGGYRISDDMKSKVSAAVNAVIIDTGVAPEEESKKKKSKKKKEEKKVDENEERYHGENYKNFLAMMKKKKMDELYEMVNSRRMKERFVAPTATPSTLTRESFKKKTNEIEEKILLPILTTSSQLITMMSESSALPREPSST